MSKEGADGVYTGNKGTGDKSYGFVSRDPLISEERAGRKSIQEKELFFFGES